MRRALALAILAFASLHSTGTIAKRERDCLSNPLTASREHQMPYSLPSTPPSDASALARSQRIADAALAAATLRASASAYLATRGRV